MSQTKHKSIFITLIVLILSLFPLLGQYSLTVSEEDFYFDAIIFRTDSVNYDGRVDMFAIIPYKSLSFINANGEFASEYDLIFIVTDTLGRTVKSSRVSRTVFADNYFISQGGTGEFSLATSSLALNEGKYKVKAEFIDKLSSNQQSIIKNRNIGILDFDRFDFSMSGLMLLSSIEATESGKYKITPFFSDNVSKLEDGFFVFFESYNRNGVDSVDFYAQIQDRDADKHFVSDTNRYFVGDSINRHYIKIPYLGNMAAGEYFLRVYGISAEQDSDRTSPLAIAERSVIYKPGLKSLVYSDFDEAIDQLQYIASSSEQDFIEDAETAELKEQRFREFWKKHDPTPGTNKNEAFDQYYARIQYANERFDAFMEGWRTDRGMIFVIYGPPDSVDRTANFNDQRQIEIWRYNIENLEFVFIDTSGLGDFRLNRSLMQNRKYEYGR